MPLASPTAAPDVASLALKLSQRAQTHLWMALGQIALGVAATFILPILFISIPLQMPQGLFWPILAIVIVAMYVCEWWTHGDYYLMQARYTNNLYYSSPYRWGVGAAEIAALPLLWEILLFAPRQVFEGATWLRCVLIVRSVDLLRAAEILKTLLASSHAIAMKDLQKPDESPLAFGRAMAHLLVHEWIGTGEAQGGQAWLTSESREALFINRGNDRARPPG